MCHSGTGTNRGVTIWWLWLCFFVNGFTRCSRWPLSMRSSTSPSSSVSTSAGGPGAFRKSAHRVVERARISSAAVFHVVQMVLLKHFSRGICSLRCVLVPRTIQTVRVSLTGDTTRESHGIHRRRHTHHCLSDVFQRRFLLQIVLVRLHRGTHRHVPSFNNAQLGVSLSWGNLNFKAT